MGLRALYSKERQLSYLPDAANGGVLRASVHGLRGGGPSLAGGDASLFFGCRGDDAMPTTRSCTLSVKVKAREKAHLRAVADAKDISLAELVRRSVAAMLLQELTAVELPAQKLPVEAGHT
jgi:hypothetical protein